MADDAPLSDPAQRGGRRVLWPGGLSARLLLAEDDPIIPATDLARLATSEHLVIERTRYGGHCGFIDFWGRPSYADRFMLEQFQEFDRGGDARPRA